MSENWYNMTVDNKNVYIHILESANLGTDKYKP